MTVAAARAAIVAALIAAAAVLPSLGGGGGTNLDAVTTSSQRITSPNSSSPTSAPSSTGTASPDESPVCATGPLQLVGSTAFMMIAQEAAGAYMQDCSGAIITVKGGDSAYGLTQVQTAVNSRSSSAGSMIAMYDGISAGTVRLKSYPMGYVIFSVVAYTGLFPGSDIATDQLRTIFVKPGEPGVVAVGRRGGSGSREAFIIRVLSLNPAAPDVTPDKGSCPHPTGNAVSLTSCTEDSTADMLKFVNGTPNAIGYAETYGPFPGYLHVSVISIDNVPPTLANVRNGSYRFWAVEHLYAYAQPTTLTKDFLAFLPHYIESHPPQDFIACSDAPNTLETDCHSAVLTPPRPKSGKPARPPVDILSIGSLVRLGILLICAIMLVFYRRRRPRVVMRPWREWLGWGLALVAVASASPWSVHLLGSGALGWVVTLLAAIGAALLLLWHRPASPQPSSRGPGIATRDPDVIPRGRSAPEPAVTGLTPENSQQSIRPVPFSAGSPIQPVIESKPGKSESAESWQRQPNASAGRIAFVSYSHEDEQYRQQLEKWLAPLTREKLISVWHDREILPGQNWNQEIDKNLESADIVLLLVSQDFLASEYAYGREMLRAMERHNHGSTRVVPIIVRSCDWRHSPLSSLEVLPSKGNPVARPDHDEAWLDVVQGLRRLISGQG